MIETIIGVLALLLVVSLAACLYLYSKKERLIKENDKLYEQLGSYWDAEDSESLNHLVSRRK